MVLRIDNFIKFSYTLVHGLPIPELLKKLVLSI